MNNDPIPLWAHVHGATSHFPIAMLFASFLFDFGAILFKRPSWRVVAFWTLITAAVVALPAVLSGLTGYFGWFHVEAVDPSDVKHLLPHRNAALIASGFILVLALWRTIRRDKFAGAEFAVYLAILTLATATVGYAGWLGAYVGKGI